MSIQKEIIKEIRLDELTKFVDWSDKNVYSDDHGDRYLSIVDICEYIKQRQQEIMNE